MKYFIVFGDDGHGMETAGKRTPKFEDGTFMHENEFNRAVIAKMQKYFQDLNSLVKDTEIIFVPVAPTDADVPLKTRTDTANRIRKEYEAKYGKENVTTFFISVHANAFKGVWGEWGGIETFVYGKNGKAYKVAQQIQAQLMGGTEMRDRGVKVRNFHVLRETTMPAALAECAFMDNKREAILLRSDEYRTECAKEIFTGICLGHGIQPKFKQSEPSETDPKVIGDALGKLENLFNEMADVIAKLKATL